MIQSNYDYDYDTLSKRHDKVKISTKVFGKHHLTKQRSSEVRLGGLWQVSWHKFFPALYGWFKLQILCFLREEGGTLKPYFTNHQHFERY